MANITQAQAQELFNIMVEVFNVDSRDEDCFLNSVQDDTLYMGGLFVWSELGKGFRLNVSVRPTYKNSTTGEYKNYLFTDLQEETKELVEQANARL